MSVKGFDVVLFGYALDADEIVALAFAGTQTRCKSVWGALVVGEALQLQADSRTLDCRRARGARYEVFEGALRDSHGHLTVVIAKSALTQHFAALPDDARHFYTFGPFERDIPFPLWHTQLRQFLLLPAQPGWPAVLWPMAARAGLTHALTDVAGFAPVWRVQIDDEAAWRALYTEAARAGRLPVAAAQANGAPPAAVSWSLNGYHRRAL